jgi:hypothetical protein
MGKRHPKPKQGFGWRTEEAVNGEHWRRAPMRKIHGPPSLCYGSFTTRKLIDESRNSWYHTPVP